LSRLQIGLEKVVVILHQVKPTKTVPLPNKVKHVIFVFFYLRPREAVFYIF